MRDKVEDRENELAKPKPEGKGGGGGHQAPPPPPSTASPPSASSSPTHEFSFTISLHPPLPPPAAATTTASKHQSPPSIAVDLSPADEIFFHGHLLPLHLLSHLPVSPRSSTNSIDSFTLPIRDLLHHDSNVTVASNSFSNSATANNSNSTDAETNEMPRPKPKSKSFSLFGRWRKGVEMREKEERERAKRNKQLFDVSHVLKRYVRMVRPLLSFRGRRKDNINLQFSREPYSFSGILSPRGRQELRGRRGEFSAPASMRTSPTNSGLLVATGAVPTSTSDSTMEELQAAIQAAIAHCKNSIAKEEKVKC